MTRRTSVAGGVGLGAGCCAVFLAATSLAGCVAYHPRPIDPPRLERELRSRSLADPGLRAFIAANSTTANLTAANSAAQSAAGSTTQPAQWPPQSLTLLQLTLVGYYFSPELDAARARVELAEAGVVAAGARPNPAVSLGGGYSNSPESALVFHFLPSIPIETAHKRSYRILEAERQADAVRLELAEIGWRLHSRIRAALADHFFALRLRDLMQAEEGLRAESVAIYERRLAVGEVSRPDVAQARTEQMTAALARRAAESQVAETLTSLAAAVAVPVSALAGVQFEWGDFEDPPAEENVPLAAVQQAGLLNRVDVRRVLAEYAAHDAALRLEVARQYPDIDLNPAYDFDEGHHKFALGPALALPVFNRNQGPIAQAEARRKETGARFLSLQAQAIGEMEKALAQYRGALAEFRHANAQLVELQQTRERLARRAVAVGETDRLALADIRVQRAVAGRARLEALRKAQAALGALEDSVQQPLDAGVRLAEVPRDSPR